MSARSLILGIETSCDDTGVAVIDLSGKVLADKIHSQTSVRMGGVIPTFAMHSHAHNIHKLVTETLEEANVSPDKLTAVAVSNRPGLKGPLLVGTDYAKYMCLKYKLPMIPIHHMEAHALTARMIEPDKTKFPFLVLLISGGHSLLALASDIDQYSVLGYSIDDSPGEALDKCSRMLGIHNLPNMRDMAGGKAVEILANSVNNQTDIEFPVPMRHYRDCRFSFAGVKATVYDYVNRTRVKSDLDCDEIFPQLGGVCAALQHSVTKHLCERLQRGIEYLHMRDILDVNTLVVSGGVASNNYIRQGLRKVTDHYNMATICPPPSLCTDNGVMIAWNGLERWRAKKGIVDFRSALEVGVETRVPLGEDWHPLIEKVGIKCKWIKI